MPAPKYDPFDQYYYDELGYMQPMPWRPHYYSYSRGQAHRCADHRAPVNARWFHQNAINKDVTLSQVVFALEEVLYLRSIPASGRVSLSGGSTGSIGTFWNAAIMGSWDDVYDHLDLIEIARLMGDDKMPARRVQNRLLGIRLEVARRLGYDGTYVDYMPEHRDYAYIF